MNRIAKITLPIIAGTVLLTGCISAGSTQETENVSTAAETGNSQETEKLKIVTTTFPEYDWVKNIMGEKADDAQITLLCDNGTDMHSYQPSVEDIVKISESDVFIYTGGESDSWVKDALDNAENNDIIKVELLDDLGSKAKEEETVEGMQTEGEEHESGSHDEEDAEYDEHIWLSLKNASVLTDTITAALCKADIDNASVYRSNADKYKASLNDLDSRYTDVTQNAALKTLVFADRFPFRYLTDDYGLDYYAAFPGCSAETEAGFDTVVFLAKKIDELSLKHVMIIEGGDGSMAQTVISNTKTKDQDVLELNSLQSVTSDEVGSGLSYLGVMEDNLSVLEKALN